MKHLVPSSLCLVILLALTGPAQAETNPLIEAMVSAVSQERVVGFVQTLQDFQTRHSYTQGNTDAGLWLYDYFDGLGIEVEFHEFLYGPNVEVNIIARIPGVTLPEEVVAISGHFDSTSENPYSLAPGADDDASGVAAALEAATIFRDYQFERTVEFMCFNVEEQGRRGSAAIASDYLAAGVDLVAVLNNDMIGYWPTGWNRDLDVAYDPISESIADQVVAAGVNYVGIPISKKPSAACQDDHVSFTQLGIPAVTNMDCWEAHNGGNETTPHYHRTTDTVSTLNLPCMTQAVQVNIAALAELALPLSDTGVDPQAGQAPAELRLLGNRPNPFNPATEIAFFAEGTGDWLNLLVFDAEGRLLREIEAGSFAAGPGKISWDGRDGEGRVLPSGVYLYRLIHAGGTSEAGKALLLK